MHRMVCGQFKEGISKELELDDVEDHWYEKAVALCIKGEEVQVSGLTEAIEVGRLAERLQMEDVRCAAEEMVLKHLTMDECAVVLSASLCSGLSKVEELSRGMALERFEEFAMTAGYLGLNEELLGSLLDDDRLASEGEDVVFQAAKRWMNAEEGTIRGEELLKKIRFGLMREEQLAKAATDANGEGSLLKELVREARLVKADRGRIGEMVHMNDSRCIEERRRRIPRWAEYDGCNGRSLSGHMATVSALAVCGQRVCSGSRDGTVRVWSRQTLQTELVLLPDRVCDSDSASDSESAKEESEQEKRGRAVCSVAWWEGRIISGHNDGRIRVWNIDVDGSDTAAAGAAGPGAAQAGGRCEQVLADHATRYMACRVHALTVCGERFVSGSDQSGVRVWRRECGSGGVCVCESVLRGHMAGVRCLAAWRGEGRWLVASGSDDTTIRVWDAASGAHQHTLEGHTARVLALVVSEGIGLGRLLSGSRDGTIRAWNLGGGWSPLQTVQAYPRWGSHFVGCLASSLGVGGRVLVSGSVCQEKSATAGGGVREVRVWRLEGLECEHTLAQAPGGRDVGALVAVEGGEVWGGVGAEVVVWGRGAVSRSA